MGTHDLADAVPAGLLDALVDRALAEDVGGGDVTTLSCVAEDTRARGNAVAKSTLVACGGALFARVFERLDPRVACEALAPDGARLEAGAILWRVHGPARPILTAERVALNFVQRMSGIATLARRFVEALPAGARTRIADTRKTTPGLRLLERYAVRVGGAHNHRHDLASAVMIKDNHIVAAGGIRPAVEQARARAPHTSRVEVEVTTLAELDEALAAGADVVLLDNMATATVREAVARSRRAARVPIVEISGGVTLARVPELAAEGVDVISVGALTHSAPAVDISLELSLEAG
jgi:nicotinate-nucleotide pyrophosphorylase (carboxylating)